VRIIFFHGALGLKCLKETLVKELTKPKCYLRHRCLKLLLVDAIFIWFGDEMLFALTTLKNLENGIWYSKALNVGARALFRAYSVQFTVMVTNGISKLDYASVIFVDPGVQIGET